MTTATAMPHWHIQSPREGGTIVNCESLPTMLPLLAQELRAAADVMWGNITSYGEAGDYTLAFFNFTGYKLLTSYAAEAEDLMWQIQQEPSNRRYPFSGSDESANLDRLASAMARLIRTVSDLPEFAVFRCSAPTGTEAV